MCGFAGILDSRCRVSEDLLGRMNDALVYRGPDDSGLWLNEQCGIGFAHRRLSIVDLSPQGHQPMISPSGRYVIAYNGEIYNFNELRAELEADACGPENGWRGHSDTEVLLAAIEAWGLGKAVSRFVGMFAFALWDEGKRMLHLVRDRLGIKPLYFGWVDGSFVFASEIKALKSHTGFNNPVNRDSLTLLLKFSCIPAPHSIFENIYKLVPGTMLSVTPKDVQAGRSYEDISHRVLEYWSAKAIAERGAASPFEGADEQAIAELDDQLRRAVVCRMIADVPLGAYLSGGIDSSTVVALMQAQSNCPVKTFSIGFDEEDYNEANHAKRVAGYLGTDHTELYVSPQEARDVIPLLPTMYCEPFADSSQIPTFLVSKLARSQVTVSLSGDGGDELFCGYQRYFWARNFRRRIRRIPETLQRSGAALITTLSPAFWNSTLGVLSPCFPRRLRPGLTGERAHEFARLLAHGTGDALYHQFLSHWEAPDAMVTGAREPQTALTDSSRQAALNDFMQRMMYMDLISYLPNDILTKIDRASMAVSLEARVPMLDHRVVEFAWRLPTALKVRNGDSKWILRQVLNKYLPKSLVERPKMGFGVPIDKWLRGPLRDWAETLLNERRLREEGYFDPAPIRQKWDEHVSGGRRWHYYLWDVLMFQTWLEAQSSSLTVRG